MNRRAGRTPWVAAILIVAVSVAAAFGVARLIHALTQRGVGRFSPLPLSNVTAIAVVQNDIVAYDGSTLHRYNSRGREMWGEGVTIGVNYSMDVSSRGVALWKDDTYSVLNIDNTDDLQTGSTPDNLPIISARAGSRYLAILYGADDDSTIEIKDMNGVVGEQSVDSIHLESQVVLDYGFFSDGALFWVMSVDTSGTVPTCAVTTYRPSRRSMSGSISDVEQVIYHAQFEKDNICLVGEDFIKRYDYTGTEYEDERTLVYGWYLMGVSDDADHPLMLFAPTVQVSNTPAVSDVRLVDSHSDRLVRMPFPCRSLVVCGEWLYGFSDAYVMCVGPNETAARAYAMPVPVDTVAGVTDDHVAVVSSNGVYYLVTLP